MRALQCDAERRRDARQQSRILGTKGVLALVVLDADVTEQPVADEDRGGHHRLARVGSGCGDEANPRVVRDVRDDDREEVVTERLKGYDRQTTPVLEYFRASKFDVWEVDGAGPGGPQAIARLIQGMLKDKGYRN